MLGRISTIYKQTKGVVGSYLEKCFRSTPKEEPAEAQTTNEEEQYPLLDSPEDDEDDNVVEEDPVRRNDNRVYDLILLLQDSSIQEGREKIHHLFSKKETFDDLIKNKHHLDLIFTTLPKHKDLIWNYSIWHYSIQYKNNREKCFSSTVNKNKHRSFQSQEIRKEPITNLRRSY